MYIMRYIAYGIVEKEINYVWQININKKKLMNNKLIQWFILIIK